MLKVVGVLLSYVVARIVPALGVGWLVGALGSPNEDARTIAYMALVKLGPKHSSRLVALAKSGRQTTSVLQVLGDVGDTDLIGELKKFATSDDAEVAGAAQSSIDAIQERCGTP